MKRWIALALPLAIALLTIVNPSQSRASDITDNNSNSADDGSYAFKDNLNGNDVAVNDSAVVENNLNGPIANDVQFADQAANDESVAVKDVLNGNSVGNDTQDADQAANDNSIAVGDVSDIGNNKSENTIGNDVQVADQAANDNSIAVKETLNDNTLYDFGNDKSDHSVNISDIHVAVATSVLFGQVTGNSISMTEGLETTEFAIVTGDNCFASGEYTSNGISAVSMNTGIMSQTQQSINVQANVNQAVNALQ
jgi:hypothetical protein